RPSQRQHDAGRGLNQAGPAWRPAPCHLTAWPKRGVKTMPMTREEYHKALAALNLKPCSRETADALGLSISQLYRISSGRSGVSRTIAALIRYRLEQRASVLARTAWKA